MVDEKKLEVKSLSKISFNDYVETYEKEIKYSIRFIKQDHDFFIALKADIIKDIAQKQFENIEKLKILDIGSGIGLIDHHLAKYFKNLFGVDIEEGVIEKARKCNPEVLYESYDGHTLPFEENSMDIVFAINVMHHIPGDKLEHFLKEIYRVTKNGGISIVMEHNPLNPLTRIAVSRCEFDKDAALLYKNELKKHFISLHFKNIISSYILFFPFRKEFFRKIENLIRWLPLGAQYYICGMK